MSWIARLNSLAGPITVGGETLEVLHWSHDEHLPDNVPHRHTYFEICCVGKHGAGRFIVEDVPHKISPGDLFIARPGVIHQIVNTGRSEMELSWVSFGWIPSKKNSAAAKLLNGLAHSDKLVVSDESTQSLWRSLHTVARDATRSDCNLLLRGVMASLLLVIARAGGDAEETEYSVVRRPFDSSAQTAQLAVRYIHDNLSRPLPVAEIAAQVHVSPRHLSRLMHDFCGVSPADYVERARLDRARHLLERSTLSIKQVAAEIGYVDVHHFTRVFAKRCNIPPGEYRKCGTPRIEALDVPDIQKPGALV